MDNISFKIMRFNAICIKIHPIWGHPERDSLVGFYSGHEYSGMIEEMNSGNLQIKILYSQKASFRRG